MPALTSFKPTSLSPVTPTLPAKAKRPASPEQPSSSSPSSPSRPSSHKKKQRISYRFKASSCEIRQQKCTSESNRRLDERITEGTTAVVAIPSVQKQPTSDGGFIGSSSDAHAALVARLKRDKAYRSQVLESLQPIPFKYALPIPLK